MGGGVHGGGALENSIIAGNFATGPGGDDCYEIFTVAHNLVGQDGGSDSFGSNIETDNPKLGPLADNGGPTLTHARKRGSPAVGEAGRRSAPPRDQRGRKRGSKPDIGAFER